jgi:hypothetical protein
VFTAVPCKQGSLHGRQGTRPPRSLARPCSPSWPDDSTADRRGFPSPSLTCVPMALGGRPAATRAAERRSQPLGSATYARLSRGSRATTYRLTGRASRRFPQTGFDRENGTRGCRPWPRRARRVSPRCVSTTATSAASVTWTPSPWVARVGDAPASAQRAGCAGRSKPCRAAVRDRRISRARPPAPACRPGDSERQP